MAVTSVGTPTSANTGSATATSFATTFPTTPVADDIALLVAHLSGTSLTMSVPAGWAAPTGWTNPTAEGTASRQYVWWKRLTAGEAAPTITNSGSVTGGWECHIFRGADTGATPVRAGSATASATSIAIPSLATVAAGSMLLVGIHGRVATGTIPTGFTPNASYSETIDHATNRITSSANVAMENATRSISTAGTYGGETWSVTNTITSSIIAALIEVKPSATNLAHDTRHADWIGPAGGVTTASRGLASAARHLGAVVHVTSLLAGPGIAAEARSLAPLPGTGPAAASLGIAHVARHETPVPGVSALRGGFGVVENVRHAILLPGTTPVLAAWSLSTDGRHVTLLPGVGSLRAGFGVTAQLRSITPLWGGGRADSVLGLRADARGVPYLAGTTSVVSSLISSLTAEVRHAPAILGVLAASSAVGWSVTARSVPSLAAPTSVLVGLGLRADVRHVVPLLGLARVASVRSILVEILSVGPIGYRTAIDVTGLDLHADARFLTPLWSGTIVDATFNAAIPPDVEIPPDVIIVDLAPYVLRTGDGGLLIVDLARRTLTTADDSTLVVDIGGA